MKNERVLQQDSNYEAPSGPQPGVAQSALNRNGGGHPVRLFVLVDALGWKFLEGREFLSDVLTYRQPLRTVLGFSSGAIPAMLTGVPPSVNGHWNLFYFDPAGSPFRWLRPFLFLPDNLLEWRVTRKLLKLTGRHLLGLGPLFECSVNVRLLPWFNYVEKKNIYARGGITGAPSIFDQVAEKGISHRIYTYHEAKDEEILREAKRDIRNQAATFYFLYLSEMDMFLHMHCKEPQEIERRLCWYDRGLREVWEAACKVDPGATMTLVSDHGMTPVRKYYDLMHDVEALGLQVPGDYLVVYDSTMARFWFFNEPTRTAILETIKKAPCGRLLEEQELRQLGVFFPDHRFGEAVFLLHPGWLLARSNFNGPSWIPAGMHGYHPDDPDSDGVFLANHPPEFPVSSVQDVHRCMLQALEVEKA